MSTEPYPASWRPHFVIIGAAKAATTWIQKQLQSNPALYLPDPEPHYFSREYGLGPDHYRRFFADVPACAVARGEKSADYLADPEVPARMARALPDARVVVQLRNPVERAYSDYKMFYRRGTVARGPEHYLRPDAPEPFARFLQDGLYGVHLGRWLRYFPPEQILVFLYEDVATDPRAVLERVSAHIGIKPWHGAAVAGRENDSRTKILPLGLRKALQPLKPAVATLRGNPLFESARAVLAREVRYPGLPTALGEELREWYRSDVEHLATLIGRDLSHWLPGHCGAEPARASPVKPVQSAPLRHIFAPG